MNKSFGAHGINFRMISARETSSDNFFAGSEKPWEGLKTREHTTVDQSFKNLLATAKSLENDILKPVMEVIPAYTRLRATRAEFPLMFLGTVFNCCRQSDLTKADPSTFTLVSHEYLGRFVRCLVTETKTRQERFVDFYPVAGAYDPIVALDLLLRTTEPPKKSFTSSFTTDQEYQLLRSNLVGTYDKFLAKTCPFTVFQIKNGPKSHFGRHLMASYLSKWNLGHLVSRLGNWRERDDAIGSSTAKAKYGHKQRELPDYLYAFLSGYYKLKKLAGDAEDEKKYSCQLVNPSVRPVVVTGENETDEVLNRLYRGWHGIVQAEVLSFIKRYSEEKRKRGPLEAKMEAIDSVAAGGPSPPCTPSRETLQALRDTLMGTDADPDEYDRIGR